MKIYWEIEMMKNKNVNVIYIILIVISIIISGCMEKSVYSPKTGTILKNTVSDGNGMLKIINRFSDDSVVALTRSNDSNISVLSVYIRSHDSYTINNISDNSYKLYYKLGEYWNNDSGKFSVTKENSKFDKEWTYSPTVNHTIMYTVVLDMTQGNAKKVHIYPENFPK